MASRSLDDLPSELITKLLTYLPVKTLLILKTVSKSFLNQISDPKFIKTHLELSLKDPNLALSRLLLSSVQPPLELQSCSLQSVLNFQCDNAIMLDESFIHPQNSSWILGSFNGLVCIAVEEGNLFIWNPSTRVSKQLPETGIETPGNSFKVYGFGYDERIDDYKVVGIFCLVGNGSGYTITTTIYSLRSDSWRSLGETPIGLPVEEPGRFANGTLHWAVSESAFADVHWVIVSLDLATETYGEIEQISYGAGAFDLTLGVLKGCICVLSNFKGIRSDIWIMNEYKVKSSWAKLCVIPYDGNQENFWYSFPFWITERGELLMEFKTMLVLYNPNDGTFRSPVVLNLEIFIDAVTYVESFVNPNRIHLEEY